VLQCARILLSATPLQARLHVVKVKGLPARSTSFAAILQVIEFGSVASSYASTSEVPASMDAQSTREEERFIAAAVFGLAGSRAGADLLAAHPQTLQGVRRCIRVSALFQQGGTFHCRAVFGLAGSCADLVARHSQTLQGAAFQWGGSLPEIGTGMLKARTRRQPRRRGPAGSRPPNAASCSHMAAAVRTHPSASGA